MGKAKSSARDKFGRDMRLSSVAWDERYRAREMAWDMGRAAPPLERAAKSMNLLGKRVLVPGCGRGFEARLFAALRAEVTAVDFSAVALREAAKYPGGSIEYVQADARQLPRAWTHRFDVAVEHTCFCAIDPKDRARYLAELHRVLKPSGVLLGLFFIDFVDPDGPPFGIYQQPLRELLAPYFDVIGWEVHPRDSWEPRRNQEALITAMVHPCSSRR